MCLSSDPVLMLLQSFAEVFTRPTFSHVLLLVCGTLLASGRRTITAALRAVGRGDERHFTTYHRCAGYVRHVTHDEIADAVG